jgi:hypothetical protein
MEWGMVTVDARLPFYSAKAVGEEAVQRAKARRRCGSSKLPLRRIEVAAVGRGVGGTPV